MGTFYTHYKKSKIFFGKFLILVTIFYLFSTGTSLAQTVGCSKNGNCYSLTFNSYNIVINPLDNRVAFTYTLSREKNDKKQECKYAISYVFLELPTAAYFPIGTLNDYLSPKTSEGFKHEETTNPKGIKFEETRAENQQPKAYTFTITFFLPKSYGTKILLTQEDIVNYLKEQRYIGQIKAANNLELFQGEQTTFSVDPLLCDDQTLTPLPVTLVSFTGTYQNQGNALKWITASEENNSHFEVERSLDGETFTAIGKVKGKGNSNQLQTYHFTDRAVQDQMYYYRLKQEDIDGKTAYSKVIAVKAGKVSSYAKFYPNPASSSLNIDLSSFAAGNYLIKVASLTGTILKNQSIKGGEITALDVKSLPNGTYLLMVEGQAGNQVSRFVKIDGSFSSSL
ncbi:T9SS type A sorting domain-containing protein [Adhaeribacter aquaticus]|uniref:T9SS type A sorting domain-containing protein n=1 Tax=Adhaeribacter aquaticus TaxID=299567 RepID=UPI000425A109|nr:T9SS type A sorting domain-containing protein [Adhaeribacter aquaticus]